MGRFMQIPSKFIHVCLFILTILGIMEDVHFKLLGSSMYVMYLKKERRCMSVSVCERARNREMVDTMSNSYCMSGYCSKVGIRLMQCL